MPSRPPHRVVLLGGPNGAGKTTTASRLLPDFAALLDYVNADAIATGLSGFAPESAAREAGRLMIRRLRDLAARRVDFAFETTLASRTFAPFLRRCRQSGYAVSVVYLWLRSPDLALQRVALRVREGGHPVPESAVRRRYASGWRNFLTLYRPLADVWEVYDNSRVRETLVARSRRDGGVEIADPDRWAIIEAGPQAT